MSSGIFSEFRCPSSRQQYLAVSTHDPSGLKVPLTVHAAQHCFWLEIQCQRWGRALMNDPKFAYAVAFAPAVAVTVAVQFAPGIEVAVAASHCRSRIYSKEVWVPQIFNVPPTRLLKKGAIGHHWNLKVKGRFQVRTSDWCLTPTATASQTTNSNKSVFNDSPD